MILRRYGSSYQSVNLNFDSKALNEIGFRRNHEHSIAVEEFDRSYVLDGTHEFQEEAQGDVQDQTEQELLSRLQEQIEALLAGLGDGEVLVAENEQGHDYPKTRQQMDNVIVEGENRRHFTYTIAPLLRMAVHRPKG
tara:strand:+ start:178 stop:588 length:411 start_codon:yes stop_codon:yes gene_type:complete